MQVLDLTKWPEAAANRLQPDLHLTILKPSHSKWIIEVFRDVSQRKKLIYEGWIRALK